MSEIERLVARNRRDPAADTEQKIVQLRNAAFADLRNRPGGHLPEVDGIQPATGDVSAADLVLHDVTPAGLRAQLLHTGAALLPRLIDVDRVAEFVDGIEQTFDACDAHKAGDQHPDDACWYTPFDPPGGVRLGQNRHFNRSGGGIWATDSPRGHFMLVETLQKSGLTHLISGYFGEPPAISVNKSTLRRVPSDARTGDWHQDGAFLGDGIRTINAWMCLSDCGVDAPGLDLVPTRLDLADTGTEGAHFDWAVAPAMVDQVRGDVGVVRPGFRAGDVLLFDHLFLHRTAASPSMTLPRYAIETWFFAASRYPDTQFPIAL